MLGSFYDYREGESRYVLTSKVVVIMNFHAPPKSSPSVYHPFMIVFS